MAATCSPATTDYKESRKKAYKYHQIYYHICCTSHGVGILPWKLAPGCQLRQLSIHSKGEISLCWGWYDIALEETQLVNINIPALSKIIKEREIKVKCIIQRAHPEVLYVGTLTESVTD